MSAGLDTALSLPARLTLAAIVLAGLILRLWANDAAVPFRMGVDEPAILSTALRMIRTGDFHPHFFDYGGLTLYLHAAIGILGFVAGARDGRWSNLDAFWEGDMLVPGRTATAIFAAVTIVLVFRIGLRWGTPTALVAALAMALLPAHVREAHFILTDTPLTLLVTATLLLSLRAAESGRLGAVALAGLAAGLAAAIKYNGAAALIMPLIAAVGLPAGRRLAGACIAVGAAGAGFLLTAPYTVLALPEFLNRLAALMQAYNRDRPMRVVMANYVAYLRNWFAWPGVLPVQIGYIPLAAALGGWAVAIARASGLKGYLHAALLVVFPVLYFWFMSSQTLQYGRYLLPIGPMLAVGLGLGIVAAARAIGTWVPAARRAALPFLLVLLLGAPTLATLAWLRTHGRTSTLEQAGAWLVEHGSPGDRVAFENVATFHLPPPLVLVRAGELISRTVDEYRADQVTWLILTSDRSSTYHADPVGNRARIAAYQTMLAMTEPAATFTPTADHPGATVTILRLRR